MMKALNWHEDRREEFFPADPSYFKEEIKNSEAAQHEYKDMEEQMKAMHCELNKSIPFFSTRYQVEFSYLLYPLKYIYDSDCTLVKFSEFLP